MGKQAVDMLTLSDLPRHLRCSFPLVETGWGFAGTENITCIVLSHAINGGVNNDLYE